MPANADLLRTDSALATQLRMSVMRLRRRLLSERHPDNPLSLSTMSVLGTLFHHGEQTLADLARRERVQPPTMTRTVKCLVEAGYVERRPDEHDGRRVLVSLSERGQAVVHEDRDRRTAWLARQLDHLTPAERAVLRDAAPLLERLAQGD